MARTTGASRDTPTRPIASHETGVHVREVATRPGTFTRFNRTLKADGRHYLPAGPNDLDTVIAGKYTAISFVEPHPYLTSGEDDFVITLHHLNYSRSLRVIWLLEQLKLPYALVRYERTKEFRAPPELAKVHPLERHQ